MQSNLIEQIQNRVSLLEEAKKFISIKRQGSRYMGLCPFHKEKTPSFFIDESKGVFHCFGCEAGGNLFDFIGKIKNLSFPETLNYLSGIAGLDKKDFATESKNSKQLDILYKAVESAKQWFEQNLYKDEHKKALIYLKSRGLTDHTIKYFNLGFAPYYKSGLTDYLKSQGFSEINIISAGLRSKGEYGPYDIFNNRIIFPITNRFGKTIAFGGRSIDDSSPKYINSKDSDIFHKKLNIYNLYNSINNLNKNIDLILVEGYMDVISLHQSGITTGIAPLGTAVSKDQLAIISKVNSKPKICFDGDEAGYNASIKTALLFLQILTPNLLPKFCLLPQGEDPDSYIKSYGITEFKQKLKDSLPISLLLWSKVVNSNAPPTLPEEQILALDEFTHYCDYIKSANIRKEFIDYFRSNLNKLKFKQYKQISDSKQIKNLEAEHIKDLKLDSDINFGYFILSYVITCPTIYNKIDEMLTSLKFKSQDLDKLRQEIIFYLEDSKNPKEDLQLYLANRGFINILYAVLNNVAVKKTLAYLISDEDFIKNFKYDYENYSQKILRKELLDLKMQSNNFDHKLLEQKIKYIQLEINKLNQKDIT